ncbi:benzoate/H(+) symporter BenE family transporter [Deinococcus gobiensis]|uniref:Benzoate membrane transport protein, putative n=1 Tax=Deinococcus gobiensis (strain DSM 21396 / JCM 16679 / CGMCC 1.7299 / I-0) TaxID=745776 RepID=H8GU33_DEIGI|nr:benzoate/H(+) symporter BenE family transporter [Deinococcus gobiensis]AFD24175.1 Benzoate membrane transport protein, putative [Deinococcus gobiensis I-0]
MTAAPPLARPNFWRDSHPNAVLSGLVAILIGWAGPNVLIYSVAQAAHLSDATAMSWLWGHAIFAGLAGIVLSLRTRMPILSTWSTPGIALLLTALPGIPFAQAIGAFLTSAVLVILLGTFRPLTRALGAIPPHLAAALNAAILLPFGFHAAQAFGQEPLLVGLMVLTYFLVRQWRPLWAVAGVLVVGVAASAGLGLWHPAPVAVALTAPQLVWPEFSLRATLNLALPLTLLAFTGQFVPGFGVLKVNGYEPAPGPVLRVCGLASAAAAFVGCHNLTLGALLANIVSGPEAHPDPARRYTAAVWAGVFNIAFGLFAGTFLHLLGILPVQALAALAGLALLAAIGSSLQAGFRDAPGSLAPALVVLVTLSGVTPLGIGAAFWGILAGLAVHALEVTGARRRAAQVPVVQTPAAQSPATQSPAVQPPPEASAPR